MRRPSATPRSSTPQDEAASASAIDQWYTRRQKDAEGEFYRKIAGQSPQNNFNSTTQGLFLATPDGKLLGFTNNRSPEWVRAMLKKGLAGFTPGEAELLTNPKPDPNFTYRPPEGGLILSATSKVLKGYEKARPWRSGSSRTPSAATSSGCERTSSRPSPAAR